VPTSATSSGDPSLVAAVAVFEADDVVLAAVVVSRYLDHPEPLILPNSSPKHTVSRQEELNNAPMFAEAPANPSIRRRGDVVPDEPVGVLLHHATGSLMGFGGAKRFKVGSIPEDGTLHDNHALPPIEGRCDRPLKSPSRSRSIQHAVKLLNVNPVMQLEQHQMDVGHVALFQRLTSLTQYAMLLAEPVHG
jgi:hypothetical protein